MIPLLPIIASVDTKSYTPTRYFRRNEGSTDYATIPEVTLAGDFVIEFDAIIDNASSLTEQIVIGNSENSTGFIRFNKGVLQLNATTGDGLAFFNDIIVLADNELTGFTISYVSSTSTLTATSSTGLSKSITFTVLSIVVDRIYSKLGMIMSGILANLKIYDNGTLIRDYPLNDNSSTLVDLANGQNGTVINGNASDWGLFDKQENGDWLGQ